MKLIIIAGLLTAAGPESLNTLSLAEGQTYVQNRQAILQSGTLPDPTEFNTHQWRQSLAAEALRLHAAEPQWALRSQRIPGLELEVYRQTRHGRPSASATVDTWPAVLVLEELVFMRGRRDLSAQPAQAYLHALLRAAGRSQHPAAGPALTEILYDGAQTVSTRATAAYALGLTGEETAVQVLQSILQSKDTPLSIRESALAGLGGLPFAISVEAMTGYVEAPGFAAIAVSALGRLARTRGGEASLRPQVTNVLLQSLGQAHLETHVVEALGRVGDETTAVVLQQVIDTAERSAVRRGAQRALKRIRRNLRRRAH